MQLAQTVDIDKADPRGGALFGVEVVRSAPEAVLFLHGELDCSTRDRFAAALADIDDGYSRVVLDLAELTFIDCTCIGLIHRARTLARTRGSQIALRTPNRFVSRVLELTDLGPAIMRDHDPLRPVELSAPDHLDARAAL